MLANRIDWLLDIVILRRCQSLDVKLGLSVLGFIPFRMQAFRLPDLYHSLSYRLMYQISSAVPFVQNFLVSSFPSLKYLHRFLSCSPFESSCVFHIILTRSRTIAHIFIHHLNAVWQL